MKCETLHSTGRRTVRRLMHEVERIRKGDGPLDEVLQRLTWREQRKSAKLLSEDGVEPRPPVAQEGGSQRCLTPFAFRGAMSASQGTRQRLASRATSLH
jgi:hypothetical protein